MNALPDPTQPLPCDVKGYHGHKVANYPPSIRIIPTSGQLFTSLIQKTILGAIIVIAFAILTDTFFGQNWRWVWITAFVIVFLLGLRRVSETMKEIGKTQISELSHGYTTKTWTVGQWWVQKSQKSPIRWNFENMWILDNDGVIVHIPTGIGCPPGYYPSPQDPNAEELWSGIMWTGQLRLKQNTQPPQNRSGRMC